MAPPVAAAADFRLELGRRADFVAQTNLVQCVGASMQMMINIMAPQDDRTAVTQHRAVDARAGVGPSPPGRVPRQGRLADRLGPGARSAWLRPVCGRRLSDPRRSAQGGRQGDPGDRQAGRCPRLGRPACLGFMTGFRATADPPTTHAFRVTQVTVMDPLYPRTSTIWGRSAAPGTHLTPGQFGRSFVPRRPFMRRSVLDGPTCWSCPSSPSRHAQQIERSASDLRSSAFWIVRRTSPVDDPTVGYAFDEPASVQFALKIRTSSGRRSADADVSRYP